MASPLGEMVFNLGSTMNAISVTAFDQGKAAGLREGEARIKKLEAALRPFVVAYVNAADEVGDSDLYPEQPRSVAVTLGACRKAWMALPIAKEKA